MKLKTPIAVVAALLLLPGWTTAQDSGSEAADEQQAEEREHAQKLRRERDSLLWKDPTDLSSMSRRSSLDHQLNRYQSELERTGTLNQSVTTQLRGLQAR